MSDTPRYRRDTGRPFGKQFAWCPINPPPVGTAHMTKKTIKREPGVDRPTIEAWARQQPWFANVWMGRTYNDARWWIWVMKKSSP